MLRVIPSFYENYSKNSLFISANSYKKNVIKDYCIAHHDDKMSFHPIRRYNIRVMLDIEELLQEWFAFCITYEHVVCPITHFKFRFSDKKVAKNRQLFDDVQRAVYFNERSRRVVRLFEEETLQKKVPTAFSELFLKEKINAN